MEKKIRMADIAEQLGVSVVSVSKALNGQEGVSEETRAKIIRAAEELGYVPLRMKSVSTGVNRSGNIGILVADRFFEDNAFYAGLYRQVLIACTARGYSALLEIVTPEAEKNCILPTALQGGKVDGIVFMGEISRSYIRAIEETGVPYTLLDFYDENFNADCITGDNVEGGFLMTDYLLKKGKTKIAFAGSIFSTSSIMDRYLGYVKALLRAGIKPREDYLLEDRDEQGLYIPIQIPEEFPEAFFCNCDATAHRLIEELERRGLRIPKDVLVAGYDDFHFVQATPSRLTSYRVDLEGMGKAVVDRLLKKMQGEYTPGSFVLVRGRLVVRETA